MTEGILPIHTDILNVASQGWGQTLFSGVQQQDKEQQAQNQETASEYKEKLFLRITED